jgi:hypothetical protein
MVMGEFQSAQILMIFSFILIESYKRIKIRSFMQIPIGFPLLQGMLKYFCFDSVQGPGAEKPVVAPPAAATAPQPAQ